MKGTMILPSAQYRRSDTPVKKAAKRKQAEKSPAPTYKLVLKMATNDTLRTIRSFANGVIRCASESPAMNDSWALARISIYLLARVSAGDLLLA